MKTCSRCKIEKPLSEFHKKASHKDGHTTHCKKCRRDPAYFVQHGFRDTDVKRCSRCEIDKPMSDFHRAAASTDGRATYCKLCALVQTQIWRKTPKGRLAAKLYARQNRAKDCYKHVKRKYGLTAEAYDALVAVGRCEVCGASFDGRPSVDHDHKTGKVRGVLCKHCNTMLGYAKDDPAVLRQGANYLEQHTEYSSGSELTDQAMSA